MDMFPNIAFEQPPTDILLLCALKDEFDQVLKVSNGIGATGWCQSNDANGRIVADAEFTATSGQRLNVRATWAGYMGREQTQAVASTIIQNTPAKCLAMCGICAGRKGKVELGDVIFGERLWSYDVGKSVLEAGREVFQGDMLQYRPSEIWVQHMQNVSIPADTSWLTLRPRLPLEHQEIWVLQKLHAGENPIKHQEFDYACPDWPRVIERLWLRGWVSEPSLKLTETGQQQIELIILLNPKGLPPPAAFQVHTAPLATGAAVKEDEEVFPKLSHSMRKVLGLDMEASGLAALAEAHQVPALIVKGVSDFGNKFKDDRYRAFAARASAEALFVLLRNTVHMLLPTNTITAQTESRVLATTTVPNKARLALDLIDTLAELYPDVSNARSLWIRAGGKSRDVENIPRPRDLWQRLWQRCCQGAAVTPQALLVTALDEFPGNLIIIAYINRLSD
jgi:nucleoside phosphorylase